MYVAASPYLPCCKRVTDCMEKVENVVKPPHIPTVTNNENVPGSHLPITRPIRKEPATLIKKVLRLGCRLTALLRPYRKTEPMAPPRATIR